MKNNPREQRNESRYDSNPENRQSHRGFSQQQSQRNDRYRSQDYWQSPDSYSETPYQNLDQGRVQLSRTPSGHYEASGNYSRDSRDRSRDYTSDYGREYNRDYNREYNRRDMPDYNRISSPISSRGEESLWEQTKDFFGFGPKGYKRSDDRICEEVCETLYRHPSVDARDIEVTVTEGAVYLKGSVPDRSTKRMAEDCAERITGVTDVYNQIQVKKAFDLTSSTTFGSEKTLSDKTSPMGTTKSRSSTDIKTDTKIM